MPTPEPIPPVLSVRALRKQYRDTVAVDDISFEVGRGEIVGLLGPNGAGKITTINTQLGLPDPSSGGIVIDGLYIARHLARPLAQIGRAAVWTPHTNAHLSDPLPDE